MERPHIERNFEPGSPRASSGLRVLDVGIGEMKLTRDPRTVLVSYGVGSCVCVCSYDPEVPVAGMAHILLPEGNADDRPDTRYADEAIPILVEKMKKKGADGRRVVFKIAGGSNTVKTNSMEQRKIGDRNIRAVRKILSEMGAAVAAEDVGGGRVRTVRFYTGGGEMVVSSIGGGQVKK